VENSVGKPAAPLRRGAKCRHGKESLANSHPPFKSLLGRKARQGLDVFWGSKIKSKSRSHREAFNRVFVLLIMILIVLFLLGDEPGAYRKSTREQGHE